MVASANMSDEFIFNLTSLVDVDTIDFAGNFSE